MANQKEIAKILDRAAVRSGGGASSKQVWFLAGLMAKNGEDGSEFLLGSEPLSARLASELIEVALASAKRQAEGQ